MAAESLRVKICGITNAQQAIEIVKMGAHTLGFICVPQSPRYITAKKIAPIVEALNQAFNHKSVQTIGVFADISASEIVETVNVSGLSGVQLHGNESIELCQQLKKQLPHIELLKAFRIKDEQTLHHIEPYLPYVDAILLDAYHPQALGGTGVAWDWTLLKQISFSRPWLLAGGINPNNVLEALESCAPNGVDLSSGVEQSPGVKDLAKVQALFNQLQTMTE